MILLKHTKSREKNKSPKSSFESNSSSSSSSSSLGVRGPFYVFLTGDDWKVEVERYASESELRAAFDEFVCEDEELSTDASH